MQNLETLNLNDNSLNGPIPFININRLKYLELSSNNFTGILPQVGSMNSLVVLDLSRNQFTGPIPPSFVSFNFSYGSNWQHILNLSMMNHLIGPISGVANWSGLEYIDLSHNDLMGRIPPELGNSSSLMHLDLSSNRFSGNILVFQDPCKIVHLDLSMNQFVGSLDGLLGSCYQLEYLDLSSNNLVGDIAFLDISKVRHLNHLNLSRNHLSVIVPNYLFGRRHGEVCLSTNDFSVQSTCQEHKRRNKPVLYLVIFLPIIIRLYLLVSSYVFFCQRKSTSKKIQPKTKKHGDVCWILNYDGTIAYEDFIMATMDFDLKYCIGTGGYCSVYKAKLPNGKTFALKKTPWV